MRAVSEEYVYHIEFECGHAVRRVIRGLRDEIESVSQRWCSDCKAGKLVTGYKLVLKQYGYGVDRDGSGQHRISYDCGHVREFKNEQLWDNARRDDLIVCQKCREKRRDVVPQATYRYQATLSCGHLSDDHVMAERAVTVVKMGDALWCPGCRRVNKITGLSRHRVGGGIVDALQKLADAYLHTPTVDRPEMWVDFEGRALGPPLNALYKLNCGHSVMGTVANEHPHRRYCWICRMWRLVEADAEAVEEPVKGVNFNLPTTQLLELSCGHDRIVLLGGLKEPETVKLSCGHFVVTNHLEWETNYFCSRCDAWAEVAGDGGTTFSGGYEYRYRGTGDCGHTVKGTSDTAAMAGDWVWCNECNCKCKLVGSECNRVVEEPDAEPTGAQFPVDFSTFRTLYLECGHPFGVGPYDPRHEGDMVKCPACKDWRHVVPWKTAKEARKETWSYNSGILATPWKVRDSGVPVMDIRYASADEVDLARDEYRIRKGSASDDYKHYRKAFTDRPTRAARRLVLECGHVRYDDGDNAYLRDMDLGTQVYCPVHGPAVVVQILGWGSEV